jgi:hypothetical protein
MYRATESDTGQPVHEGVALVGQNRGDAGAHRPLARNEGALAANDGGVADQHPFDVGDGVVLAGLEPAEGEDELSGAYSSGVGHRVLLCQLPRRHKREPTGRKPNITHIEIPGFMSMY